MTTKAKLKVVSVLKTEYGEKTTFEAVTNGTKEDNSFSKWTPSAKLELDVTNPDLFGKFVPGKKFYLDFNEASE